jgi:peptidoglycan/xylan/chitin deacetylase (PgdA/CDA1 family)
MKRFITLLLLVLVSVSVQKEKTKWPDDKKAVIVLTYDDGLPSQLDVALPQLDSAGFKATFFLTGDIDSQTIPRWRALASKGYELGNHTLFHPCSTVEDNPVNSTLYTPQSIVNEIEVINHFLYAVDGNAARTFAYPCAETTAGKDIDYVDTLRKLKFCTFTLAYAYISQNE